MKMGADGPETPRAPEPRAIDAELQRLQEAQRRHLDDAPKVLATELRAESEMPPAGGNVPIAMPASNALPADLAEGLVPPPGQPRPRTPRRASTSVEGTRGRDAVPVVYYEHQHATWTRLLALQLELSQGRASSHYAAGRERMNALATKIPSLAEVDTWLFENAGWHVVRANGYVEPRRFLSFVADGLFPCMDLLRHEEEILYSPEPDMYHDIVGHLPTLCDPRFAEYTRTFGRAGTNVRHEEQLEALSRIYWFTMEFGLVKRPDEEDPRVYGAALLTGLGELLTSNRPVVQRLPFAIDAVVSTPIDVHRPNDVLFWVENFDDLLEVFVDWAKSEALL